jgi:hypothetical protein
VSKRDGMTRAESEPSVRLIEAAQADSDGEDDAGAGSEQSGHRSRIRTFTRTHFASPPHGQGTQGCRHVAHGMRRIRPHRPTATPLSSELWHCTAYPVMPEATWAQPLSREELS